MTMTPLVETKSGPVKGTHENGIDMFKGIPFAEQPVGPLRWRAPEPVKAWSEPLDCSTFRHSAPQILPEGGLDILDMGVGNQGEDCLWLNIWRPTNAPDNLPVMVWIHGGGFTLGSGSQTIYEGQKLASRGVVVVTVNYRLGALGFLRLEDVTNGKIPATGNEGLLDQIAALEWVHDNIEAFGGNKNNVTVFGESAGGISVGALLGTKKATSLFHRAIPQSGACNTYVEKERASRTALALIENLSLTPGDADGLMSACDDAIVAAQTTLPLGQSYQWSQNIGSMAFAPVVDDDLFTKAPIDHVREGTADGISIMTGSCLDEWNLFAAMDPGVLTLDEAGLDERMKTDVPEGDAAAIKNAYKAGLKDRGVDVSATALALAMTTDRVFRMQSVQLLEAKADRGEPGFNYMVTHQSPAFGGLLAACHAVELPLMWGTYDKPSIDGFAGNNEQVATLSDAMMNAWTNFAQTGDPSNGNTAVWPAYNVKDRPVMIFGDSTGVVNDAYGVERAAWDAAPNWVLGRL